MDASPPVDEEVPAPAPGGEGGKCVLSQQGLGDLVGPCGKKGKGE